MIEKYPYTDLSTMNLDWVINKVKEMIAAWAETRAEWTDTKAEFEELKLWISNYFTNLDVQTEINNKLDAMYEGGQLSTLIAPYVAAGLPAVVADQIGAVVAAQISAVVADQLPAVAAAQLPAIVATETAGQAAAWLSEHVDPDTGYVIDNTLRIPLAAADAKATGDGITANRNTASDLRNELDCAFKYGKNFLNQNERENGYYQIVGTTVGKFGSGQTQFKCFPSFVVPAGVYHSNANINNFSFIQYTGQNPVAITTVVSKISDTHYTFTLASEATVFITADSNAIDASTVMFTSMEIPSEYAADYFRVAYQFDQIFTEAQNILVVGKTQKYKTISGACSDASAGDVILVLPGEYFEQVSIWGKKLHIIGLNKNLCKLIDWSGDYRTPPLEMNIGTLANMTLIETGFNADPELDDDYYKTAYCLHIESGLNANNEEFLIDNCHFENSIHCCIGCGLYENLTVHFRNCTFVQTGEGSREGHERAAFYYHSNTGQNVDGQRMIVENCLIHSSTEKAVYAGKVGGSSGETISTFAGNTIYSDLSYNTNDCVQQNFDSDFSISPASCGNNVGILNNGVGSDSIEITVNVAGNGSSTIQSAAAKTNVYGVYEFSAYCVTDVNTYSYGILEYFESRQTARETDHLHCNVSIASNGNIYVFNRNASTRSITLRIRPM